MKRMFVFVICVLALAACNGKFVVNDTAAAGNEETQWFVYNHPVNGYDISIQARYNNHCKGGDCNHCIIIVHLKKGKKHFSAELPGASDSFERDLTSDTIYIDNPSKPEEDLFLDFRSVVSFADVDFDGEDELIICGFPRPYRKISNMLDCEDFTIYKITGEKLIQIHNLLFDRLSKGECRTIYTFDTKQKTITLTNQLSAFDCSTEVYWFENGSPYKLDYIYENKIQNGEYLDKPDSLVKCFLLPREAEKFRHTVDSIFGK